MIELKVDDDILVRRIESRVDADEGARRAAAAPTTIRRCSRSGSTAYRAQTAPLVDYYRRKGALRTVDGMASIDDVAAAIGRALADAAFRPVPARKAAAGRKPAARQGCAEKPQGRPGKPPGPRPRPAKAAKAAKAGASAASGRKAAAKAAPRRAAREPQKGRKAARARRLTK